MAHHMMFPYFEKSIETEVIILQNKTTEEIG